MAIARRLSNSLAVPRVKVVLWTRHYSVGLFGRSILASPEGFDQLTNETIGQSNELVSEITKSVDDPGRTVDLFDELSNTICRTADLAECVRLLHPNAEYSQKAQNSCVRVSTLVEQLNTNKNLYESLKGVIDSPRYINLDQDTKRNVSSLMHDFEISGIHLSEGERERVVALNEFILSHNHAFMSNCNHPMYVLKADFPQELSEHYATDGEFLIIDHVPCVSDERVRELGYRVYHSSNTQQGKLLDDLLKAKYELASTVGYKSFAQRTLKDSMAGSPEVVMEFLSTLSDKLRTLAEEEAREALGYGTGGSDQLLPWNLPWLIKQKKDKILRNSFQEEDVRIFFPLDACLNGVDLLFSSLFKVRLKEEAVAEGEVWHNSVRKFSFVCEESNEQLGHLYCDLHHRPGKIQSDCQLTIQGCRKMQNGSYQMPISALNLCLPQGHSPCLSQHAVENLFHEMGHAAHSVLGRTRYQNLSGTRCPTDFAEVPSNLMELFLQDERILKSFAKSSLTRRTISDRHAAVFRLTGNLFPALSAQTQIMLSMMDQIFHSTDPIKMNSTVEVFANLHRDYSPVMYVSGTASFYRFTHLATYAGKYYSYLWSRAVANLIWRKCFKNDPFSHTMGKLYKERMLAFGGGENPNTLVNNLLGYQPSIDELVDSYYQEIVELKEKMHRL